MKKRLAKSEQGRGQGTGEVIVHPFAKAPEPFLEEINTVRLEGRYFAFDPKRANTKPARQEFKEGERTLEIIVHPDYGHPSILAYRILQHVFLKVTKEGKPFPDVVSFSYRELGRLIGRDVFGGRDVRQIENAIKQLKNTEVIETTINEKKSKTRKISYSLIVTSGIITEGTDGKGRIQTVALQIHQLIMESMRRDHFIILNWPVIAELPPLSATLYKRLYLHFSNLYQNKHDEATLSFEKDYETTCTEWFGGLKPMRYKTEIERQLKPHFEALKHSGLIKAAQIVRRAKGDEFKIVFKPGRGFFRDYDHFYLGKNTRILQFERAADEARVQKPLSVVRYFFEKRLGTSNLGDQRFMDGDIQFARQLIDRIGYDECRPFIDFALASAKSTHFEVKTLRGLEQYLVSWEANKAQREQARIKEQERVAQARQEALKETYGTMAARHAMSYLESLTPEGRNVIKAEAEQRIAHKSGRGIGFSTFVSIEERRIALEQSPVPSFDEWQRSQL
jgi:flagellar motility protein MotE (MotC chaperone)